MPAQDKIDLTRLGRTQSLLTVDYLDDAAQIFCHMSRELSAQDE